MPLITNALRLLGLALGATLAVSLCVSAVRSRRWLLLIAASAAGLGYGAHLFAQLTRAIGDEQSALATAFDAFATAGVIFAPAAVANLILFWTGLHPLIAAMVYLPALGALAVPERRTASAALLLTAGAVASLMAAHKTRDASERLFWRWFSASIAAIVAAGAVGLTSAGIVWATLAPLACVFVFIYRHHVFGLEIGRRFVFTLGLGAMSAVYLLAVRLVARSLEQRFDALASAIELTLTLAAAILWLPLYAWMTRVMSRRSDVLANFGRRVIEQAVSYLDLGQRVTFLAEGVARTFKARRVALLTFDDPPAAGVYPQGETAPEIPAGIDTGLEHVRRAADPQVRALLERTGYHYYVPLRYEDRITGALLIDCAPRASFDDLEPVVADMARQISHSIEECRLVDRKIVLERELHAQEQMAALGNVAAAIAHEVKNPLSSIRALAQLMGEDSPTREKFGQDLGYIVSEADRLTMSVRQLLTFARPAPEPKGVVELSALLEAMARTLDREHGASGIHIEAAIEPGLRLGQADGHSLQQIALNLMLNSIQASRAGSVVKLDALPENGAIVIRITDQGPGIPANLREKIFQPYFTTKQKGTGLGLAIVRKNVRDLGGTLDLESPVADGGGTRMTVRLPAR